MPYAVFLRIDAAASHVGARRQGPMIPRELISRQLTA